MNDLDFWGKSWWQGVGVVLSAVLSAAGLIIALRQNRRKKLSYKVNFSAALLDIDKQVKDDLKITYKNKTIEQINIVQIQVINDGKIPIKRDDFDGPIELEFSKWKEFFDIEVIETLPEKLKVEVHSIDNKVTVQPLLLNPGDFFILKITFDAEGRDFEFSTRIEDLSNITVIPETPPSELESYEMDKLPRNTLMTMFMFPILLFLSELVELFFTKVLDFNIEFSLLYILVPLVSLYGSFYIMRLDLRNNKAKS